MRQIVMVTWKSGCVDYVQGFTITGDPILNSHEDAAYTYIPWMAKDVHFNLVAQNNRHHKWKSVDILDCPEHAEV